MQSAQPGELQRCELARNAALDLHDYAIDCD
jgi:hypothetical protein